MSGFFFVMLSLSKHVEVLKHVASPATASPFDRLRVTVTTACHAELVEAWSKHVEPCPTLFLITFMSIR